MEYFPYIFLTIKEMGAEGFGIRNEDGTRGKFKIKKIVETFPGQPERIIYDYETPDICLPLQGFDLKDIASDIGGKEGIMYCTVKFETPVRLKKDGKIVQFIDFRLLIRSIITRLNALVYFYGNRDIMADFNELLEEAEKVSVARCNTRFMDFKWHSGRQKTNIMLGGLVGEMGYRGNISLFYPYLKISEITGVGKNTTFGFGRIKVEI
jgi:CRISPR-associated endoribonuclease Cas6